LFLSHEMFCANLAEICVLLSKDAPNQIRMSTLIPAGSGFDSLHKLYKQA